MPSASSGFVNSSQVVVLSSGGCAPSRAVRRPAMVCSSVMLYSASITRTAYPLRARPLPRASAVMLLPVPPLQEAQAMTRAGPWLMRGRWKDMGMYLLDACDEGRFAPLLYATNTL